MKQTAFEYFPIIVTAWSVVLIGIWIKWPSQFLAFVCGWMCGLTYVIWKIAGW